MRDFTAFCGGWRDQLDAELAAVQPLKQHALKQHAQKMKMRFMACDR
jgi:hypothetical protein